ncbi:MAG: hypothetical protein NVSMB25_03140 [Thermoleophilaceae bacterium]
MNTPEVSVVIPSHGRLLRLRWLLNELEEQTLERSRFEVVVVHDYLPEHAQQMLEGHPLAQAGVLRVVAVEPRDAGAARQRNIGWRAARAPLIAFTDDDCRPESGWLEALLEGALANPGAIVQGGVRPDPLELEVFAGVLVRFLEVRPPDPLAQTANILYPRALLERVGGFDPEMLVGEDVDLYLRAGAAGARRHVGVPDALVNHAIEAFTLRGWLRVNSKWEHLPRLVKHHRVLRRHSPLGCFWTRTHVRTSAAMAGLAASSVASPAWAALALPWVHDALSRRGPRPLERLVALAELPTRFAGDAAEVVVLARGSLRYRTLLL